MGQPGLQAVDQSFGHVLLGDVGGVQAPTFQGRRRGRTDRANPDVGQDPGASPQTAHPLQHHLDGVRTGEDHPLAGRKASQGCVEVREVRQRLDGDGRHLYGDGALLGQQAAEARRLGAGPCHHDP